jgi:hypothetical protein
MKKSEFKEMLKPLIKECIKEVVFEEGVLSGLISEVVKGTSQTKEPVQAASEDYSMLEKQRKQEVKQKINETKKKMLDAIGNDTFNGVDLFEGTRPLGSAGSPADSTKVSSPLTTYAPGDAGVDISSIFSSKWKNLV